MLQDGLSSFALHTSCNMFAGHDRTGTTVWRALTLWVVMALGEAALLTQSSMAIAVWCALFGLPSLYLQCRHILDVLVEEALQLVAAFLKAGQPLMWHQTQMCCLKQQKIRHTPVCFCCRLSCLTCSCSLLHFRSLFTVASVGKSDQAASQIKLQDC